MFGRLGALDKMGSLGAGESGASSDDTAVTISQIAAVEAKTNATAVVGISQVAGIEIETDPAAEFNAVAAVTAAGKAGYVGAPAVSNIAAVTASGAAGYTASVAVSNIVATSIERTVGYSWTNTEGATFEAAMSGTYSDATLGVLDTLITDLKSGLTHSTNTYAALDFFALHFLDNATDALRWFNSPSTLMTAVNSPTHTPDDGYGSDGSSSYVNTNFVASTDAVQMTATSACIGLYLTAACTGAFDVLMGVQAGTAKYILDIGASTSTLQGSIDNGGRLSYAAGSPPTGLIAINRTGASARQLYLNGVSVASDTQASSSLPTLALPVLAFNSGSISSYAASAKAAVSFGGRGMTANEHADFKAAIDKAVTAWAAA